MNEQRTIEVCFSPVLYPYILNNNNYIVVIIDVLRASTSICTAFSNGVRSIIPVAGVDEAKEYKNNGFIVAAERNGLKLDFADFGNSPFNFTPEAVRGKDIVYSTTNGTQALKMVESCGDVIVSCFNNLSASARWLSAHQRNVLILCSGWKQKFSLEDSVCAGALIEELMKYSGYCLNCDSASASLDLWNIAKLDLPAYMEKALHRHRLKKYGLDDVLQYTFTLNNLNVVPRLVNGALVNAK